MHSTRRITRLPDEILRITFQLADPELIISETLGVQGLSFPEVNSKSRKLKIIMTRHIISYLLSVNPERSFDTIGKVFMKDHSTAIHSRDVVEDMIESDRSLRLKIAIISARINAILTTNYPINESSNL